MIIKGVWRGLANWGDQSAHLLRRHSVAAYITIVILTAAVTIHPAVGQVIGTGSIQGTVLDQQGRVIPNVEVTATDPATGRTVSQATSSAGVYSLNDLPPATYNVYFKSSGFASIQQKSVVVNALAVVGLNVTMKIGSTVQQVVVSSAPPDLETENGTLDTTIPNSTYTSLPIAMNGSPKSPLSFLSLIPGSASGDFGVQEINGGPGNTSFLYQNGLPVTTSEMQGDARNINGSTTTEVVDQFQVVTSGVPAYYSGQGVTNLVLKAGTNSFHGDVYENNRNTVFDAAGFFSAKTPVEHQNEYGFSVGGPFVKNKLFFFMNLDRFRYVAGNQPSQYSLPTAQERSGDFSQLLNLPTPVIIYDPATTVYNANGSITRCAFGQTLSGSTCIGTPTNIIPSSRFSSVAKQAESYLPATAVDTLQNNYSNGLASGETQHTYFGKIDYTINDKHRAYAMFQTGKVVPLSYYNGGPQLPLPYTSGRYGYQIITIAQLGETWTIKPDLVNVFGVQFNAFRTPFVNPTTGGNWASKLSISGLPIGNPQDVFPEFDFGGGVDNPTGWANNGYSESFSEMAPNFVYQDNLQLIKGKHSLTIGGQLIAQQENTKIPNSFSGFQFINAETAGFTNVSNNSTGTYTPVLNSSASGHSYASFLLGLVNTSSAYDTAVQETGARYKNAAFYVQDDYKLTPRLTINIGLRYIIPKPFKEAHDRNSWFNPYLYNSEVGIDGALQFAGYTATNNCHCDTQVQTHYKVFDPRVGFAFAINPKTVVRGSYTIIHYNGGMLGGNAYSQGISLLGFSASPSFQTADGGITPAFNLDDGFPSYIHPPFYNSTLNTGFNTTTGATGGGVSYNRPDTAGISPYTENWNLTVSRAVTPSMTLQVSYAGSASHHIAINGGVGIYSDQIDTKYESLGPLLNQPLNSNTLAQVQALYPQISIPYSSFVGSVGQSLRPFAQYAGMGDSFAQFGSESYNALQVQMQRRMTSGLYFLGAYTWSKNINNTGGTINFVYQVPRTAYNLHQERSVDSSNIPHQISLVWVYKLPFGKGQLIKVNNRVLDAIVSGWQLSGIQQYNDGTPLGTFGASGCYVLYSGSCWANLNPNFSGSVRINGSYGHGVSRGNTSTPFINASAFTVPSAYTWGNAPRTMAYGLRNPWSLDEDATLGKDFSVEHRLTLHLQADGFNLFNRVVFGGINTTVDSTAFGTVSGQANAPRILQFEASVKF